MSRSALAIILTICAGTMIRCSALLPITEAERQAYRSIKYDASMEQSEANDGICELHRIPKVWAEIQRNAGMCVVPPRRYVRALLRTFPNSYWSVSTCFCEPDGLDFAFRFVCPACRAAERRWRRNHGWDVDGEVAVPKQEEALSSQAFPDETHGSVPLLAQIDSLRRLYAGYRFHNDELGKGLAYAEKHFEDVSQTVGWPLPVPEGVINGLGYEALSAGKTEEAIALFARNVAANPNSANAFYFVAQAEKMKRRMQEEAAKPR